MPGAQASHDCVLTHLYPLEQVAQAETPDLDVYLPVGHGVQLVELGVKNPIPQVRQIDKPTD